MKILLCPDASLRMKSVVSIKASIKNETWKIKFNDKISLWYSLSKQNQTRTRIKSFCNCVRTLWVHPPPLRHCKHQTLHDLGATHRVTVDVMVWYFVSHCMIDAPNIWLLYRFSLLLDTHLFARHVFFFLRSDENAFFHVLRYWQNKKSRHSN